MKLWSDHETTVDLLGFQHLVGAITGIVQNSELLPVTIGVFGDWGSGKSSLIKMTTEALKPNKNICILEFNGWLFEGYDDTKAALLESIIDDIVSQRTLKAKGKSLALQLLRKVNWFRATASIFKYGAALATAGPAGVAALGGIDIGDAAKKATASLSDLDEDDLTRMLEGERAATLRRSIREFRAGFAELLNETDIDCLVVVIDDLDRCLPDTILDTLEAIKLFLFVENTAFIVGAYENLVEDAVRSRFPELSGDRAEVGRDYLEKLVQFPIRLPSLSPGEMETYISLLYTAASELGDGDKEKIREFATQEADAGFERSFGASKAAEILGAVPQHLLENLALAERLAPVLATHLSGNPRQCKRFLNMLHMRIQMASSRKVQLKQVVLAKLMLLEYFRPEMFRQLAAWQLQQEGRPKELRALEQAIAEDSGDSIDAEDSKQAGSKVDEDTAMLENWTSDKFIADWLLYAPNLADEDLRPYFYFSRDKLGAVSGPAQRMSAPAQTVYSRLMQPGQAGQKAALRSAKQISEGDASAVFEAIAAEIRAAETHDAENASLPKQFKFVEVRHELASQLIVLLESLPVSSLPFSAATGLKAACKGSDAEQGAAKLAELWSANTVNPRLATAARKVFPKAGN